MLSPTRPILLGGLAISVLILLLVGWGLGVTISGAVVASGMVRVENARQVVEHPTGGVVGAIHVREGSHVQEGDVLVSLDGTFLSSELQIVERQLFEIFVRELRLQAERSGWDEMRLEGSDGFAHLDAAWRANQVDGQARLFHARRQSAIQEEAGLAEQQLLIERQIDGLSALLGAQRRQLGLVRSELEGRKKLLQQGLIQAGQVLELEREDARLWGETGRLKAQIAEARARISALKIEVVRLRDRRREEAITRLRDLQYSEIELVERQASLRENLSRLDVRAPVAGTVFDSRVTARNSVVRPAEPMMYIVPSNTSHEIAARVRPIDIDQVHSGQIVSLRFTTFDLRRTSDIPGQVARVSADVTKDELSGAHFYEAIIVPDREALQQLSAPLLPGMPVEAFMKTGLRTPFSYLIQPLTDYFERAFRAG